MFLFCVKVIDITGLTEIQFYYENVTVSTPLWVSSGRLNISPADQEPLGVGSKAFSEYGQIYANNK